MVQEFAHLQLADLHVHVPVPISILLGADVYPESFDGCWSFLFIDKGVVVYLESIQFVTFRHEGSTRNSSDGRMNHGSLSQDSVGMSRNKQHDPRAIAIWGRMEASSLLVRLQSSDLCASLGLENIKFQHLGAGNPRAVITPLIPLPVEVMKCKSWEWMTRADDPITDSFISLTCRCEGGSMSQDSVGLSRNKQHEPRAMAVWGRIRASSLFALLQSSDHRESRIPMSICEDPQIVAERNRLNASTQLGGTYYEGAALFVYRPQSEGEEDKICCTLSFLVSRIYDKVVLTKVERKNDLIRVDLQAESRRKSLTMDRMQSDIIPKLSRDFPQAWRLGGCLGRWTHEMENY
uniref:Uncharacterized protein n=1 Tax=Timema poppense TaxID=170557 RepID=A0A7R9DPL9_TIMPO|nr:unnamed protein product [Timema poppensis]